MGRPRPTSGGSSRSRARRASRDCPERRAQTHGVVHALASDMQALDRSCFSQRAPPLASLDRAPATTWRHHFAQVEGVRLHWAELGESTSKPPLVLLHGLNDCYRSWRELAPRLAVDRRVLIPDLPGHGLSGRPDASYELQWYARILTRWLRTARVRCAD